MKTTRPALLLLCLGMSSMAIAEEQRPDPGPSRGAESTPFNAVDGSHTASRFDTDPADQNSFSLMQHFSGHWQNVSGDIETTLSLYPNGLFRQRQVAARGERASSPSGSSAGWEMRKRHYVRGNWQISGTRERGTIGLMSPDGQVQHLEYRAEESPEAPHWRIYRFNDRLYYRR